jgi:peptidoglycan/LPS O-acetylase OafA/YrhL
MFFHFSGMLDGSSAESLGRLFRFGYLGVYTFFVLSGFVIAHSLRDVRVSPRTFARFLLKRSVRLDPPYWASLIITVFLYFVVSATTAGDNRESIGPRFLAHVFYMQGVLGYRHFIDNYWTLCLEVQFYLLFAILLGVGIRLGARRVVRGGLFLAVSLVSVAALWARFETDVWGFADWSYFFLGAIVYKVHVKEVSPAWFWLACAVLAVEAASNRSATTAMTLVTASAIYCACRWSRLYDWLNCRPLLMLGRISYSLYLVHPILGPIVSSKLLRIVPATRLTGLGIFVFAVVANLAASWLLYYMIERPTTALSGRIRLTPAGTMLSGVARDRAPVHAVWVGRRAGD